MSVYGKGQRAEKETETERGRDVRERDDIMLSAGPRLQKVGIHCVCARVSFCQRSS